MPYASINELPAYVKKYSKKVQSQWRHVFNTVYKSTTSDVRAFKAANSVLKKRFKKGQNSSTESHADYMSMLVDRFLGNLRG